MSRCQKCGQPDGQHASWCTPEAPVECIVCAGVNGAHRADCTREVAGGDAVHHPSHYQRGGLECIDVLRAVLGDAFPAYCAGNVIKYTWRYPDKNGAEDLRKAALYATWAAEALEESSQAKATKGEN